MPRARKKKVRFLCLFRVYLIRFLGVLMVGMLLYETCLYLSLTRAKRNYEEVKRVRDYEAALCGFATPKTTLVSPAKYCPPLGIVTSFRHGSLSNTMWQYANVLGVSLATGLHPYVPICMKDVLGKVFSNLTIPLLAEIGHCVIPLPDSASNLEEWTNEGQSIVIKSSDLYGDNVMRYLSVVSTHFVFNSNLRDIANTVLHSARRNRTAEFTYVGVYITKTSIIVNQEYDDVFPSVDFFVGAMKLYRQEYPNALFVVVADRKSFWEGIFKKEDVYVVDEDSLKYLGAALAVLAHCNHTILASDDFAVWGSILSKGKAIVSLCFSEDFNNLMQRQTDWTYMLNNTKSVNKFLDRVL